MAATATAPAVPRIRYDQEILTTEDHADGMRHHRFRWTVTGDSGGDSGEESAAEPIEPLSRDLLMDRWHGLMLNGNDPSKLQDRLDRILDAIAKGLLRRDLNRYAVVDGEIVGLDIAMDIDGLGDTIRDWMIERAAKVAAR